MNTEKVSYMRQTDLFNPQTHNGKVAIVGCGNIGSNAGIALARLGVGHVVLFDHDTVENHNIASQHYDLADIGTLKVDALRRQMLAINPDMTVTAHERAYTGEYIPECDILVSAVDSMDVRRALANTMQENNYRPFVIDGRSGGGQIEVHSVSLPLWAGTMPAVADEDACGSRFICYASQAIGAFIANQVRRKLVGIEVKSRVLFHMDTYQIVVS